MCACIRLLRRLHANHGDVFFFHVSIWPFTLRLSGESGSLIPEICDGQPRNIRAPKTEVLLAPGYFGLLSVPPRQPSHDSLQVELL